MNIQEHTTPEKLEKYSFLWSEARLVVTSIALFMGGVSPLLFFLRMPIFYGLIGSLLTFSWIISGISAGYLLYRWDRGGRKLFGKKKQQDTISFFVMVVTGLNMGLAGLFGINIGIFISSNRIVFALTGILYLVTAFYLYKRWNESGKRIFK